MQRFKQAMVLLGVMIGLAVAVGTLGAAQKDKAVVPPPLTNDQSGSVPKGYVCYRAAAPIRIDGRLDDTPPGGALVFELWQRGNRSFVRVYYTAQSLNQMRNATPLSTANPPDRVPVFVPACGQADGGGEWKAFKQALEAATDPEFAQ